MNEEEAKKHIENFYGKPIPKNWDIEHDVMKGFTVRHLIDILVSIKKYRK